MASNASNASNANNASNTSIECISETHRCIGNIQTVLLEWTSESLTIGIPLCDWHRVYLMQVYEPNRPTLSGRHHKKAIQNLLAPLHRYESDLQNEEDMEEHGTMFCTTCTNSAVVICTKCNGPLCAKCDSYGETHCCWIRGYHRSL
jgi:hypothetical protein